MTLERKALTSLLLALCLAMPVELFAAPETAKPAAPEKAAEAPAKGKEEAPPKPATNKPAPAPAKPAAGKETAPAAKPAAGKDAAPASKEAAPAKPAEEPAMPPVAEEDEAAAERKEADADVAAAVARPVTSDPVQVYGWREWVLVGQAQMKLAAKLDTGALTSSIHAEEKELFERDGKKWVRFIVTDPSEKSSQRIRIEAPLVRIAHIKEPGGQSEAREVVRLNFTLGERKLRADFTLNNRSNMLSPVLIGRTTIKELGWVDPSRAYLADQKIMR
ncbi:ATP-dependent zinc protease [Luteolibacter flavescens]|uniref:ATP-dependent zinc protease n=1 Tax=Luteolibacter flavescens TaxID=1859460 RepID=A0ABT3FHX3_9BACT|nr:ATP-dependent zinc protease [Luteolibacter flavescens]MCW1883173.1 ATP-dependent zinc protease [Luteolibacter flavescens]